MSLLYVIGGILFLYLGGELLVRGAVKLANALGVRQLVVGLTVVAFGTSSPELAASLVAAFKGAPDLVLGNVVGSNILNIGAVLGLSVLVYPLTTDASFLRREFPFMIGTCALLFLLIPNGIIGRLEGLFLFALLCLYLVVLYRERRGRVGEEKVGREKIEMRGPVGREKIEMRGPVGRSIMETVAGTALLTLGAIWLIKGAMVIADSYGVPHRIVGLTMVAFGTSLPELASCLVAAVHRQGGIVLGNLVGSSIFNILAILGLTALVHPIAVTAPATVRLDVWIMMGFGAFALLMLARGMKLNRWEGGVLISLYVVYIVSLFT